MTLQAQVATIKVQGAMQRSAEVFHAMNELVKVPEIASTMRDMAREMERAGLIEELMNDAFESVEGDGVETAADEEVNKIMAELTAGVLAPAEHAPSAAIDIPASPVAAPAAESKVDEAEAAPDASAAQAEEEFAKMQARLQAL